MVPMINPDFSQEAGIAPGIYEAKIMSCEQRIGQKSGNPFLNWTLNVKGYKVFHSTPIGGPGAGLLKQLVRAAYSPGYDGGPINTDALLGKMIQVKLEKEQDGKYLRVVQVAALQDSFDAHEAPAPGWGWDQQ